VPMASHAPFRIQKLVIAMWIAAVIL
jgi:hypothetical protein